jgi:type I restriction enzyme R subunit
MSNFAFLQIVEWDFLFEPAAKAEAFVHGDARAACFYARRALELAVAWLYKHEPALQLPYQDTLSALIHEPTFRDLVGQSLFTKARIIKDLGNLAVHSTKPVRPEDALAGTRELFHLCFWLVWTYGRTDRPDPSLAFDVTLLPKASGATPQSLKQMQQLEESLQKRDERLSAVLAEHATLQEELERLRKEVAAAKAANQQQPDTHDYSEAETRRLFIDVLLREAGWHLDPAKNFEVEVAGMPNAEGKGFVDYVLWGSDGKPLALIEAKRTTVNPKLGEQQAKLYADCLEQMHGQRPIIYLSNGYQHWIWDDRAYPSRPVQGFYKRDELELLIQRRGSRKPLADAPIASSIVER